MNKKISFIAVLIFTILLSVNIFASDSPSPEYNAITETNVDGRTENYIYKINSKDLLINHKTETLLMIDGKLVSDAKGIIDDNYTLVPVRFISESFGLKVDWNKDSKEVSISSEEKNIVMRIGEKKAVVNNSEIIMGIAPKIINDKTYVPLRFISESLGKTVGYAPGLATYDKIFGEDKTNRKDLAIAYDPVVWINTTLNYDEASGSNELLNSLKTNLSNALKIYKTTDDKKIIEEIQKDINNTKYVGNIGEYSIYNGPYTILVDQKTKNTYIFIVFNGGATLSKVDFSKTDLFDQQYIFG